jgi:cytochrome c oxidase cbb3-type subunit 2
MNHGTIERNSILLLVLALIVVSIGGIVQIAPLFWVDSTIEKVKGMRPYTPLELAGRDIYLREGCYTCHSQMIRTLRDEVERYGHYRLAAASMYDHPFQWGSKRTGPDLARVGGKYSDQWHAEHMRNPRSVVPESIMPGYPWLAERKLEADTIAENLKTLKLAGVPYTDDMIKNAKADLEAQVQPDTKGAKALVDRYRTFVTDAAKPDPKADPKVKIGNFDGNAEALTELDAVIAYLQMLGTLVDFASFDASGPNLR